MDEKILAYRSELQKRSENTPFWTKTILTVEEAAAYTGIGRAKIRQIISQGNCPFTVNNGTQICVIREANLLPELLPRGQHFSGKRRQPRQRSVSRR